MVFSSFDALFYMASQGDDFALKKLFTLFVSRAIYLSKSITDVPTNLSIFPEDFSEFMDFLFFKTINEYDQKRGSFFFYVEYVLANRFCPKLYKIVNDIKETFGVAIDMCFDEVNIAENQGDPSQIPMSCDLAIENFKLRIASPSKHKTQDQRLKDRILLLQYAGFSESEICSKLSITKGQLRFILEKRRNDPDMINLKLEMK